LVFYLGVGFSNLTSRILTRRYSFFKGHFISLQECSLSNLGIRGLFLNPDDLPDSFGEIKINDISFIFPDKSPDKYDNITCEEQIIYIPSAKYSTVYVLGLCEWGDFSEKINLQFEDHISEEIEVFFLDWFNYKWPSKYYDINKNCEVAIKANYNSIYYNRCCICNSSKVLKSITLPYNPNMHIFGITLEISNE